MKAVLAGPHSQLADVRTILTGVFRRLYRQRNIVVHGGSTAGIALDERFQGLSVVVGHQ